ncbi:MAG TPA: response regulator transcription factor [Acidimicrobiia bacterium]|nr:response regulator transcription factor [Acidimicrobiia bacterium]
MAAPRVLLVGRPAQLELLAGALRDSGCEVSAEPELLAVPSAIGVFRPDLVVIAASPADVDAMTVACRRAKAIGDVPVVMVPDFHVPEVCRAVLAAGAEDCVPATDPTDLILTRLEAALARRRRLALPAVQVGDLLIDEAAHLVLERGEAVDLSPLEFDLLVELARHPGLVVHKADLLNHLWARCAARNSVDQAVSRLRHKLDGSCTVRTVRGVGYVLRSDEAS